MMIYTYLVHTNTTAIIGKNIPGNCGQVKFDAPKEKNPYNDQKAARYD